MKGVTKTTENETKGGFSEMLLGALGASLLGNMITGKGMLRADYERGQGMLRAGYGSKKVSDSTSPFNKL